jgi:hypothetical protein
MNTDRKDIVSDDLHRKRNNSSSIMRFESIIQLKIDFACKALLTD